MVENPQALSGYCKGCWAHMHFPTPIRGVVSLPFKLLGITVSRMNPNICTMCEKAFSRIKKAKQIETDATILFADIRGYTALTERLEPMEVSEVVSGFYDECANAVWQHDGIINKAMGDGLLSIFNFPIPVAEHSRAAVLAALGILQNCRRKKDELAARLGLSESEFGVGIGIATGRTAVGEFGPAHTDFTAIGSVVNMAARLQQSAAAGEILLPEEVRTAAGDACADAVPRSVDLKGFDSAVTAHVLTS